MRELLQLAEHRSPGGRFRVVLDVEDRTPVLHRIPLLGWLFKRDVTNDESRELLIFITPRIVTDVPLVR